MRTRTLRFAPLGVLAFLSFSPGLLLGQDRLPSMPGYARYQEMAPKIRNAMVSGALSVTWAEDGRCFQYTKGESDTSTKSPPEKCLLPAQAPTTGGQGRIGRGNRPARGRQYDSAMSPDSTLKAFYRDRNLFISSPDGSGEIAVTTEGGEEARTKFGTGSWVYGEELNQNTAMWWSPDGSKLAYYGFDEGPVLDYHLQMDQTQIQSSLDIEAYPKAGAPNPIVTLFVYDLATGISTEVDVRDGLPFSNDVVGHYVYRIEWSPDGSELTFQRTNRRQNINEYVACSPSSGSCRVMVREEWPASWVVNSPPRQYLEDGERFLWISERTGFRNIYLYDFSGELLATVTNHEFEVGNIVRVDEDAGLLYYMARDGDNHMKMQLHRVGLDGTGDVRLTDPAFNHSVTLSPDGDYFVDVAQTHDTPRSPASWTPTGAVVAELATSDMTRVRRPGAPKGGDVHLPRGRRGDPTPRHAPQTFQLRSRQEVPGPGQRLCRSRFNTGPGRPSPYPTP